MRIPDCIIPLLGSLYINQIGDNTMKNKILAVSALAAAAAANAAAQNPAVDTLSTQLTNLSSDVTTVIAPAAIGLAVAVAVVVVGRGFIKKFFKA